MLMNLHGTETTGNLTCGCRALDCGCWFHPSHFLMVGNIRFIVVLLSEYVVDLNWHSCDTVTSVIDKNGLAERD